MIDLVIDTSVIIKWYDEEENSDTALKIIELVESKTIKLVLPQSSPLEVINSLRLGKKFTLSQTQDSLEAFFDLQPEFVPVDKFFTQKITDLAFNQNLTSYDAAFLALAVTRNTLFITADYKHHQKSISKNIVWLKEWKGKL